MAHLAAAPATAIATLVVGLVLFLIGVIGQITSRRARAVATQTPSAHPQDRQGANIVLILAAIVIGAFLSIASIVTLLQAHELKIIRSRSQLTTQQ
jgi:uncharacterized membrane protein YraQ (UPF0718 family)